MFDAIRNVKGQVAHERWEFGRPFKIARESFTHADLVMVTLISDGHSGRGECCPVPHYGESLNGVIKQIENILSAVEAGENWSDLHDLVPAGAARNAVDCAFWDLHAKITGQSAAQLAGVGSLKPVETVFTISLDDPAVMAAQTKDALAHDILKVKLGSEKGDMDRIRAVRQVAEQQRILIDANERWTREQLVEYLPELKKLNIEMVEQPLPYNCNSQLEGVDRVIPIGADESCHTSKDVAGLMGLFDVVNIKLDKTGGLTEALRLQKTAQEAGFDCMVGCMIGTSLAMAPAILVAQTCRFVDIDAPLLIGKDRSPALKYNQGIVTPASSDLWG
jgi:L-alanine-DL-glutamate epimerase-like enolase superfamily enzyme